MPWRPLPWQIEPWARLTGLIETKRLPHALLLAGPRGVGKAHFALGLASFLLCEAQGVTRKPCGECRSCVQNAAAVHPNLLRLAPAEDKRDIAIDDVRALIARLHLSSHYGQARIAIIQPADALNENGANALLKTIEEPPAATHLLLVAERWRSLPATLRSRCRILRFAPPPPTQALAWLKENHRDHDVAALKTVARTPMLAGQMLEQDALAAQGRWRQALTELAEGRMQALKLAEKIKRDEAQAGLETWLISGAGWLKALLAPGSDAPPPQATSRAALLRLLADSVEGLRGLDSNGNPAMILESIMIRFAQAKS